MVRLSGLVARTGLGAGSVTGRRDAAGDGGSDDDAKDATVEARN